MLNSILVTGGSGFIGTHLCLRLFENGYNIFVVDSFLSSSSLGINNIRKHIKNKFPNASNKIYILEGDLRNYEFLTKTFKYAKKEGKNIDAVIHLAGLKSVYESICKPLKYYENKDIEGDIWHFFY